MGLEGLGLEGLGLEGRENAARVVTAKPEGVGERCRCNNRFLLVPSHRLMKSCRPFLEFVLKEIVTAR
jgi:hypothetical protein